MRTKEGIKALIKKDDFFTFLLVLSGVFSIGNAGKLIGGVAIIDLLLVVMFAFSILRHYQLKTRFFLWAAIVIYGLFVSIISLILKVGPGYDYLVTETRYFLYFVLIIQVVYTSIINMDIIKKLLPILILGYILVYLMLYEGSFVYHIFNRPSEEVDKFDFVGRISGPQTVFLSSLIFLVKAATGKVDRKTMLLYLVMIVLVYARTGSRTQLIVNILPVIWILLKEGKVISLSIAFGLGIVLMPLFLNAIQLNRFLNILNPLGDSAFMFRIFNIQIMLTRIWEEFFPLLFGYGLGSNYDAFIVVDWFESYFLDNTFITMIYKIGLPFTVIFWIAVFWQSKGLQKSDRLFYLLYILLPSAISYHFVSNPVYFLAYTIGVKTLQDIRNIKVNDD